MSTLSLMNTMISRRIKLIKDSPNLLSQVESEKEDIDLMIDNGYKALDQNDTEKLSGIIMECEHLLMGLNAHKQYVGSRLTESEKTSLRLEIDSFHSSREKQVVDLSEKCQYLMHKISAQNNHLWIKSEGGREKVFGTGCDETGDCVTRAVVIGTGECYEQVWTEFNGLLPEDENPDEGVPLPIINMFLTSRKWSYHPVEDLTVGDFAKAGKTAVLSCEFMGYCHAVCVKDGKIYDRWNCAGWPVHIAFYPESEKRKPGELIATLAE